MIKISNLIFVVVCITLGCMNEGFISGINFGAAAINALAFLSSDS